MLDFEKDQRTRSEQLVLSALLQCNGCAEYIDALKPTDFSHDLHGQIFRHIVRLMAMSETADANAVYVSMARHRRFCPRGLLAYLCTLTEMPAQPSRVDFYASVLQRPSVIA